MTLSSIHIKSSKKVFSHLTKRRNQHYYVVVHNLDTYTSIKNNNFLHSQGIAL